MIKYTLQCSNNHKFEEWFSNISDCDLKLKNKELECPECGDKNLKKAIMAPSVSTSGSLSLAQSKASKVAEAKYGCAGANSCPAFGTKDCGCN